MEQRPPTFDESLEQAYEDAQHGGGVEDEELTVREPNGNDDEERDEDLVAWLAEREDELREQSFAAADQFADNWPPKPTH